MNAHWLSNPSGDGMVDVTPPRSSRDFALDMAFGWVYAGMDTLDHMLSRPEVGADLGHMDELSEIKSRLRHLERRVREGGED